MINSKKGEAFFERVKSRINYINVPFESIEAGNRSLNLSVDPPKVDRKEFFEDLDRMSFTQLSTKYIKTSNLSAKRKLKQCAKYILNILRTTQWKLKPLIQFFKYNSVSEICHGNVIIPTPYCIFDIAKGAAIYKKGITILGSKTKFKKSKLETRLHVAAKGTLVLGNNVELGYGSDIEVFAGSKLTFNDGCASNIGLTVICGERIEFGKNVKIGRNVTVRDNNGSHYINRKGYKNSSPVIIGDKVWLCESCTIMNGVKIGDGAIVGAKSFVIKNIPQHTMVSGHPAEVIDEDIYWKY